MNRRLNKPLMDKWLEKHGPDGVSKLAVQSNVSASTINKTRCTKKAPKKLSTLERLSQALGLDVDDLFPEEKAS